MSGALPSGRRDLAHFTFGEALQDRSQPINLLESAAICSVSNAHYGHPADAIVGVREVDYMKGWESARGSFGEHAVFHLTNR